MDALLFGLYGVLLEPRSFAGREKVERAAGVSDPERFWSIYDELRPAYEIGDVSDLRWWKHVAACAGLESPDFDHIIAADLDTLATPRVDMVECVSELVDNGWTCGAVENASVGLAAQLRGSQRWTNKLHAMTLSCDIGVVKPAPEAYRVAVDAMGSKMSTTTYFDTRHDCVQVAAELGMRAVLFTGVDDVATVLQAESRAQLD